MRVYICSDLEGVACVFSRREGYINAMEYGTKELVAICNALLENGATDILLNCFHIMEYDKFPKQVRFFHSEPAQDFFTPHMEEGFDVAMITGMHAMAGGAERGNWRHTISPHPISKAYSAIREVRVNGQPIGETGLFAMFAGIHNVPVVYISGEHWACEEAKALLPGIQTLAVKKGSTHFSALSMHPVLAAEQSALCALRAVNNPGDVKPLQPTGPVVVEVDYFHPHRATDAVASIYKAERVNETTVRMVYNDVVEWRENIGCLRAEENQEYRQDTGFINGTTGFMTRYGAEPYLAPTGYTAPGQVDFASTNWGQ